MAKKITKKSLKKNIGPKRSVGGIIKVKNADGDSDTKATILVMNTIDYVPKVSVIIPVYNAAKYIKECLDSVINQTLKEIEIICVDDGSTDDSLAILKEYAKKDKRITILKQDNLHAGIARNAGLQIAKGEFLSFLDSDDFFEPDMLESLVKVAQKDKSDLVICGNYVFDQSENKDVRQSGYSERLLKKSPFKPTDIADDLFLMCNPNAWTKLFKTAEVKKNKVYFEKYISCNDITFVYTMMALANKISFIKNPYVHYRINTKINISSNRADTADCLIFATDKIIKNLKQRKVYNVFKNGLKQRIKSSLTWEMKQCDDKQIEHLRNVARKQFDKEIFNFVCGEKPKVTVIIPVYNVEKFLPQCLDSVINQSLKDIEIICINDGSPDNSLDILRRYAKKDPRITIINQKNQGLSASRNNALDVAHGDYIFFLDSDDWIDKDSCKDLYEYAKKFDLEMIHFEGINYEMETDKYYQNAAQKNEYAKENGVCFVRKEIDAFMDQISISACRIFYKADFIKNNKLRFPVGLCFEDNYFMLKALNLVQRYGVLHKILYFRRMHAGQITANWDKLFGDYVAIIKKLNELYHELNLEGTERHNKVINKYCSAAISKFNSFDPMVRNKYVKCMYECFSDISKDVKLDPRVQEFLDKVRHNNMYSEQISEWYNRITGKFLDLENPKTFNEKIQWLKVYNSTPIKTRLADKFLVRDWVKEKLGDKYLIPLLGVYDRFEDIDFSKLPDKFVIKCNHGCAYNIIVRDKSTLDLADTKAKLDKWMSENFAFRWGQELHYRDIPRKIIIEQFMENKGADALYDYKFWCFNGEVKYMQFRNDTVDNWMMVFYDLNWKKLPFYYDHPLYDKDLEKPDNFDDMIAIAKKLCQGFAFVCVDLYRLNDGRIYFGEMTFTRSSGVGRWNDDKYNQMMGNLIKLPKMAYNIDTGQYYKVSRKSKLTAYLLFPYYWCKLHNVQNKYYKVMLNKIIQQLQAFRIDIKNHGGTDNNLDIVAENVRITKPAWYKNDQGQGVVIEGNKSEQKLNVTVKGDGVLRMSFKAPDRRHDGKRYPVYVEYSSIKVDGQELLSSPVSVWHDVPFRYEMPVKDGQVVEINITQNLYKYERSELTDVIIKLNPDSDYIKKNIESFINLIGDIYKPQKKKYIDIIPEINADLYFPIGMDSRPAYWLKRSGIRQMALPFDWLSSYSLDTVLRSFKNSITEWFQDFVEQEQQSGKRVVIGRNIPMQSKYHFPVSVSVEEYLPEFRRVFSQRQCRMLYLLQTKQDICFVGNRIESIPEITKFLKSVLKTFPNIRTLIFVNVRHSDKEKNIAVYKISKKIKIYEITNYDIDESADDIQANKYSCVGNTELWNKICSCLHLTSTVTDRPIQKTINFLGIKFRFRNKDAELMYIMQSINNNIVRAINSQTDKLDTMNGLISNVTNCIDTEIKKQTNQISADIAASKNEIKSKIQNVTDDLGRVLDTNIKQLNDSLQHAISISSDQLINAVISSVTTGVNNAIDASAKNLTQLNNSFVSLLESTSLELRNNINNDLEDKVTILNNALIHNLGQNIKIINRHIERLKIKQDNLKLFTGKSIKGYASKLKENISEVIDLNNQILDSNSALSTAISGLDKALAGGLSKNQKAVTSDIQSVKSIAQKILDSNSALSIAISGLDKVLDGGLSKNQKAITSDIQSVKSIAQKILDSNSALSTSISGLDKALAGGLSKLSDQTNSAIAEMQTGINENLKTLPEAIEKSQINAAKLNSESYWADVYHDTIINSSWLKDKSVSPGRWAVSYIVLYVLYRTLNEVKPISILECGLGQSSKLTIQYANYYGADLTICENNVDWVKFFSQNFPGADKYIKLLDLKTIELISPYKSRTYAGFTETIKDRKFNLIIIDGPLGSDRYSRPEILDIIDNLASSFIIMLDDMNRIGEQDTWTLLKDKLIERGIEFKERIYASDKSLGVLVSLDLQFLTTL